MSHTSHFFHDRTIPLEHLDVASGGAGEWYDRRELEASWQSLDRSYERNWQVIDHGFEQNWNVVDQRSGATAADWPGYTLDSMYGDVGW